MTDLYKITTLSAFIEYKAKNPSHTISLKGLEDIHSDEQLAIIRELMSSRISYDLDDLATYSDLLLSNDPNQFLIQVVSAYIRYSDTKQRQIDLINESLDRGASVMAILESYKGDLEILNHFQNKVLRNKNTADQFLVRVISTHTYTEAEKEIQAKLAGAAIDKGAKIESALSNPSLGLSIAVLDNLQSVLLTENTADQFLSKVISAYTYTEAEKEIQAKLAGAAIDKGAKIESVCNGSVWLSLTSLDNLQSVLLTENTADQFLSKVISAYANTEAEKEIQAKLADAAIDKGAEVESAFSNPFGLSIAVLDNLQSVLLTENTADQFLSKVILAYANTEAEKEIQAKLAGAAIDKGAKIESVFNGSVWLSLTSLDNLQSVLLTENTADQFLSKVILAYANTEAEKEMQAKLINAATDKGAKINKSIFTKYLSSLNLDKLLDYRDVILNEENVEQYLEDLEFKLKYPPSILEFDETIGQNIYRKEVYSEEKIQLVEEVFIEITTKYQDNLEKLAKQLILIKATPNLSKHLTETLGWSMDCDFVYGVLNGGDSNIDEEQQNAVEQFSGNPGLVLDYKYRNLHAPESDEIKIPTILHHIWLTSVDNPRQIRDQDINNAIKTNEMFQASLQNEWQQFIWVNNKEILEPSIKALHGSGIEVKEITEISNHLQNYDLVLRHVELENWGIASDTLRYDLVNYIGGVYADINYIFAKIPDHECRTYDFFSVTYSLSYSLSIDNFIFGAKPHHPVIQGTQDTVRKNLITPSEFLENLYNDSVSSFTDKATADPIGYNFFKFAHRDSNVDVVYPKPPYINNGIITTDSIDSDEDDFINNAMENTRLYCPEHQDNLSKKLSQLEDFTQYIIEYELCPVEKQIIGHDSADGRTWANDD